jgi:hypothetical protein
LLDAGCFEKDLDNTAKDRDVVLPDESSFGRRLEDVRLMAARWKDNIEACLSLYSTITTLTPGVFSSEKVDPNEHHDVVRLGPEVRGDAVEKVMIPTAAAGNATLGVLKQKLGTHTTTTAHINNPIDVDGRLDDELLAEESGRESASRKSDDQYSSAVRTEVLQKDLASKDAVHFLMYYSMWMAHLGEYGEQDSQTMTANL